MSIESGARSAAEKAVKDIRRRTRRQHSSEEKIRIVLNGLLEAPASGFERL